MTKLAKMKSSINGSTLVMEKTFNAPRNIVFQAFAQPEIIEKWWGPDGWQTDIATFEFRKDGQWHYRMYYVDQTQPDHVGKEVYAKAIFQKIIVPDTIVYHDIALNKEAHKEGDKPEMRTKIDFHENDKQTKVVIQVILKTPENLQKIIAMGHKDGMEMQLNRLEEHLSRS